MRVLISVLLTFTLSTSLYSEEWIIRIKDSTGNIIKDVSKSDYLSQVSNFAIFRGVSDELIPVFITNELERWNFANQIIEQELLYDIAVKAGYGEDEESIKKGNIEIDRQIAQLYAREILDEEILNVSESDKRAYWNKEQDRIRGLVRGRNITYADVAAEIEYTIAQERMKNEYKRIVAEAEKKYTMKYSMNADPAVVIEDVSIPLSSFEESFSEALRQSGGNLSPAVLAEARVNMFDTFVAREVIAYEAKVSGFYETPSSEVLKYSVMRTLIVSLYIEDTIKSTIEESTEKELNDAYEQYRVAYKIDSMNFDRQKLTLDGLVKESKFQQKYKLLLNNLRYKNSIEKRLELLDAQE